MLCKATERLVMFLSRQKTPAAKRHCCFMSFRSIQACALVADRHRVPPWECRAPSR